LKGFEWWNTLPFPSQFEMLVLLLSLLLCEVFATQTYTVLNVESVYCSGSNTEYKQTLVGLVVSAGECVAFNMGLQSQGFYTYQIAFPAATDDTLSWSLFETECGPSPGPVANGTVNFGECTPILAPSGQLQGASMIALRDASLHLGLVIRGFTDSQCLGTHGGMVEGNIIGECIWFTSPQLGQVQLFGYSMENNVVYFGVGCGKGPSNTGSARFVVATPGQCVNSGMGAYYRADVRMPSTTTLTTTEATPSLTTAATTTPPARTSTETISIDATTTTTTTPVTSALTSVSPTFAPTSAPTEASTATPHPSSSSGTTTSQSTTTATTTTSIVTTASWKHTSPPASSWNQMSEIGRICIVLGIFIGVVLLCVGIGCAVRRLHRPEETMYEPSGEKYALLQSMHTEEDLDSENLLDGYNQHTISQ
jgi:hypothetical protein